MNHKKHLLTITILLSTTYQSYGAKESYYCSRISQECPQKQQPRFLSSFEQRMREEIGPEFFSEETRPSAQPLGKKLIPYAETTQRKIQQSYERMKVPIFKKLQQDITSIPTKALVQGVQKSYTRQPNEFTAPPGWDIKYSTLIKATPLYSKSKNRLLLEGFTVSGSDERSHYTFLYDKNKELIGLIYYSPLSREKEFYGKTQESKRLYDDWIKTYYSWLK